LILDARSESAFAAGHIDGAVNLPLTDFTAASLRRVIGRRDRPILIYCNNNFRNDAAPVMLKARPLALNIQTFINLVGYGYRNVRELNEVIDFNDPAVHWVRAREALAAAR
jgi:phage shock protein E